MFAIANHVSTTTTGLVGVRRSKKGKGSLKLDKSSVSDGESNGQGDDAGNQTSSVSNDDTLVNGICRHRGHGSGEGSNGSGLLGLELVDRLRSVAHGKSNILARGVNRSESRNKGGGGDQKKGDLLERLHFVMLDSKL